MYEPFNTKSGAVSVNLNLAAYNVQSGPDGLTLDTSALGFPQTASMPPRLFKWLLGLRLLRNVPLSYLVPDSALLPAESIRFFHVDPTWVDRLIDGVFAAANTGTLDITYSALMLQSVRAAIDLGLEDLAKEQISDSTWTPADGTTGMLIRSDLVRRWPDMIVRAYVGQDESTKGMPVLRAEPVSKDIYIALFAGTPGLVQLREPHVGVRFGLEFDPVTKTYKYENRNADDGSVPNPKKPAPVQITLPLKPSRVVPVESIGGDARTVAIELMRQSFVQQFLTSVRETRGSTKPPLRISLGGIRFINLDSLAVRQAAIERMRKS